MNEPDLLKTQTFSFPLHNCEACRKLCSSRCIISYRIIHNTELEVKYLLLCETCYGDYQTMNGLLSF